MMKKAFCGIDCEACKVYIATTKNDLELKEIVQKEWGTIYKRTFTIEDIYCEGCGSSNMFVMCQKCDILECNRDKHLDNCTRCPKFQCERIKSFYEYQEKKKNVFYSEKSDSSSS